MLGSGSWGTALAVQLARAGRDIVMWGIETHEIKKMSQQRSNTTYLPGVDFPDALNVTTELRDALTGSEDILIAVPSHAFRETLERLDACQIPVKSLAWATKGLEPETGLLPHQVVEQVMPAQVLTAVLSGPTFAAEVGAQLPSAVTIASKDEAYALHLAKSIATDNFRTYLSTDMVGVEVGGGTKNVLAIGAGISDGLGFGANSRALLITRGLIEMIRLGVSLGAQKDTFMGLSGAGDLVLTCTDDQSRNRRFGLALARGTTVDKALRESGQVVEGYYAAKSAHLVATRQKIDMPIIEQIYRVIYEGMSPKEAVTNLMRRPMATE